jgi:hypothetical protein
VQVIFEHAGEGLGYWNRFSAKRYACLAGGNDDLGCRQGDDFATGWA